VIVDMHAPGVEVRPLVQITGHPEFNEIFFTDVKVPKENLLGEVGGGWQVAMTTLLHERGTLGFALSATLDVAVRKLLALARERNVTDPMLLDRIAREWIELQALKYTNYRSLTTLTKTGIPGPEGSASKLVWSEANQRLTKLALEILGDRVDDPGPDTADGYWQYQQLRSRGNTIEAGTSEILRNIVAERVLGLPRGR
jgi:alkylation response protein AidB-like acyl-CoA dehydrogenase